jgi:hypothetical protein
MVHPRSLPLLLWLIVWPVAGVAQTPAPLRKTDLIRLLTNPALTKGEVATRIRGACLAFVPTGRDRTDLVAVGADGTVMAAISECARRQAPPAAAAARPAPTQAAPQRPTGTPATPPARAPTVAAPPPVAARAGGVIRAVALQQQVSASAGEQALLQIAVTRDGRPAAGVAVTLRVRGGQADTTQIPRAVTDARGMATFRVPAGNRAGIRRLSVASVADQPLEGAPEVMLSTLPGPPAVAEVQPPRVLARTATGQAAARQSVTVTVRDAYGNGVPGERVEFRPLTAGIGINALNGETNRSGQFAASLPTGGLRRGGEVGIFVRGQRRGSLMVLMGPLVISDAQTRFVSGDGQQGTAGQPLAAPLVFEVRDSTGAPVAGEPVAFGATNGEASPASAITDAAGRASVSVKLGPRAGATRVAAGVGGIRKEAVLSVTPGPAVTLSVLRDTTQVGRSLTLQSSQPVVLRVVARDSFGNDVPVPAAGLRATARNQRVLRVTRVQSDGRTHRVELRPQATGSAEVELEAAGVRQTLAAQVILPLAGAGWLLGARAGYAGFEYGFHDLAFRGRPGPLTEVFLGRGLAGGLSVALGVTVASLKADTAAVTAAVSLFHTSVRVEYAMMPQAKVTPVVLAGGGRFQTRAPDLGGLVRHTSHFWLAGAGMDYALRERLTFELRVTTHQLLQTRTPFAEAGHVGSLMALTAGIRLGN